MQMKQQSILQQYQDWWKTIIKHRKSLRKMHSNKKLYSCPADTAHFALIAEATNLFVAGTMQTQLWVSFHYLINFLIS